MNPLDRQLERLFEAASARAAFVPMAPAFGLEARTLAAWRAARSRAAGWDTGVLVRGLALAGVIMAVSIWPAVDRTTNSDSESLQFADSTVQADFSP